MNGIVVRRARHSDGAEIENFMSKAERLSLRSAWEDVFKAIAQHDFFLVERKGVIGCICGVAVEPETVAQIRAFALRDGWSAEEVLPYLLPPIVETFGARGMDTLAFVGIEAWLIRGLLANGFRQGTTIVTMQKTGLDVPTSGNPDVTIRPAALYDLVTILEIDRVAFEPLWWHTADSLRLVLANSAYFSVAELDGRMAGYAYATLTGRHGHLSRLAVHPHWHGQRVGARLLAEAMAFFKQNRVFGVTLNTQEDNLRSRRLYEWFGFDLLGAEAQVLVRAIPGSP